LGTQKSNCDFRGWIQPESVIDYVTERQNKDGGYTFAQRSESSAQDTYYAVKILKILGVNPAHPNLTVAFLKGLQNADGSFDSIKVAYCVIESLRELGAPLENGIEQVILSAQSAIRELRKVEVNIEASSELETTYLSLKTLRALGNSPEFDLSRELVLRLKNGNGSFGDGRGYSRMASIYYALASLKLLDYEMDEPDSTLKWIRNRENPSGGFATRQTDPYLTLDEIYYGLKALEVLGEISRFPSENLKLITRFQNKNGGFRRSIYLGISDFDTTYYALSTASMLNVQLKRDLAYRGRT
jgi:hypothetical protein